MKHLVHDAPGYRLELATTYHPIAGPTVEFISTWPRANHPDPHRLLTLTLPSASLRVLAKAIEQAADAADAALEC